MFPNLILGDNHRCSLFAVLIILLRTWRAMLSLECGQMGASDGGIAANDKEVLDQGEKCEEGANDQPNAKSTRFDWQ